eukprot:CAMPEP_0167760100 /NCGR_PEP_ID=MMETSP0110_2-20121227/11397_1 /TAXON_ID=629695 /ORGANISM="Gymnochlora sp., Strain CCMP2014" /LENGTH=372 /DNA_ID=CAMNT_0007646571 /DNA_START=338 /DNA_END=1456 /DNA_ORIENTATION=-
MNYGFFHPQDSCSTQIIAITFIQYLPDSISTFLINSANVKTIAPIMGLIGEIQMGLGLLSTNPAILRPTIVTAQIFHLMLSLPLPPSTFYPFSAICMLAFIAIQPEAFASALRARWKGTIVIGSILLPIFYWKGIEQAEKEYPPYALYCVGTTWVVCLAYLNTVATISFYSAADFRDKKGSRFLSPSNIMMAMIFAIGALPYLGIRTYPAFAMFSNLRIEEKSNHWFLPSWDTWLPVSDLDSVTIINSNLPSLEKFQVDLSPYYPASTLKALAAYNITAALWICPPSWNRDLPHKFQAYTIPFIELRRAISKAIEINATFFVEYLKDDQPETFNHSKERTEGDMALVKPLPSWQNWFFRFRSFSVDGSPCRH